MALRTAAFLLTSYLVLTSPLAAQQTSASASLDSARADSVTTAGRTARELERVRVTAARSRSYSARSTRSATRTDTPLIDVPQSATVLTRAVIADQAMQSMADVARYVPGLSMAAGEGHRDAPTIRGNNTTADFFIDGARRVAERKLGTRD